MLSSEKLQKIVQTIEHFEGFSETAYQDSGGKWTVGYGFTFINGTAVTQHTTMTRSSASLSLGLLIQEYYANIRKHINVPINFNQMHALTSLAFNIGLNALFSSTLLEYINHQHYHGAADEFLRWDHIGKTISLGLSNRRRMEREIFLEYCQEMV